MEEEHESFVYDMLNSPKEIDMGELNTQVRAKRIDKEFSSMRLSGSYMTEL